MRVCVRPAPGRDVGPEDFADITEAAVLDISWAAGGVLCIEFAADLTQAQARKVAIRCQSLTAAEEQVRLELDALDATNLAVADNPSATQRDRDVAAMLSLMVALLIPGPSETT